MLFVCLCCQNGHFLLINHWIQTKDLKISSRTVKSLVGCLEPNKNSPMLYIKLKFLSKRSNSFNSRQLVGLLCRAKSFSPVKPIPQLAARRRSRRVFLARFFLNEATNGPKFNGNFLGLFLECQSENC